jgi:hypothetical protein
MGEPGPGDPTIVAGSVGGLLASEFWSYVGVELFWRGVDCRDGSDFVLFCSALVAIVGVIDCSVSKEGRG